MANKNHNQLDFLSKCAFCGHNFFRNDWLILEEAEQKATFHITCPDCQTSAIIFISHGPSGMVSLGMGTDLSRAEVKNKYSHSAVSADEIINIHRSFTDSPADWKQLIEKSIK